MSAIKHVATTLAPKAIGPYSQAIIANGTQYLTSGFVFTAGQVPFIPETMEILDGDIQAQTRQVLTNLRHVLQEAGTDFPNVVKVSFKFKTRRQYS